MPAPQVPKKSRVSGVNGLKMLEDLLVSTSYIEIRFSIFPERPTVGENVYYCCHTSHVIAPHLRWRI